MKQSGTEVPPSPGWVRPSDVMRVRKLRAKRHALQARMSSSSQPLMVRKKGANNGEEQRQQRHNPFRRSPLKPRLPINEVSTDATLFNLLHQPPQAPAQPSTAVYHSFSEALRQQGITTTSTDDKKQTQRRWSDQLIVDWSLKNNLRFIAKKPLPWKHNFKTSEEASGTTGMTRCLWGSTNSAIDTSPNAEFYQRCLVWQHPSLPGVQLFPRDGAKISGSSGPYADTKLASALHAVWCESLRSLHQLLRVRQCPYFYVCAPTFTVVFRAAGVCGIPHSHALVTPTTLGLRNAMKEDGIDFKLPFHRTSDSSSSNDAVDTATDGKGEEGAEQDEGATSFLANLGVDTSQFASLNPNRANTSSREIDRGPLSLVYVADPDTHSLTNFLLNSSSCVGVTGPMAGVPPTLLAPVAFQGATLLPFKVKGSSVRVHGVPQYSMEVTGPLLPHTPIQLAALLGQHLDSFSLHTAPLIQTVPFSNCTADIAGTTMTKEFAEVGLVDCGLDSSMRSLVCQPLRTDKSSGDSDAEQLLPPTFRHVTYEDGKYTWTDKVETTSE